jgi:hypothetical protein
MNKKITYLILALWLICTNTLFAQEVPVSFSYPDSNNFGITTTVGLMGCAWGDYDGDGDLDVFVAGLGGPSEFFRNDIVVGDSGKFVAVFGEEGIFNDPTGSTSGAVFADFDGDGDLDLAITNDDVAIYENDGEGVLIDITSSAVPANFIATGNVPWCITAADYDMDGYVDLIFNGGDIAMELPTRVLRNNGDMTFSDDTDFTIGLSLNLESWLLMFVDVDSDYDMDLFIGSIRNSTAEPNTVLINNGEGELGWTDDLSGELGLSTISGHWGDFDNDGDMDFYSIPFTGDADGNAKLWLNNGDLTFADVTSDFGLDSTFGDSRAVVWGDVNNDGWLDLIVGRMSGANNVFISDEGSSFTDFGPASGLQVFGRETRTVSLIDYDNDGKLDAYLKGNGVMGWLLHNDTENGNNWIVVRPEATNANTAAIGARIEVTAGGITQVRYVEAGASGHANGNLWPHFGLGTATTIDTLKIFWPDGETVDIWAGFTDINQYLDLVQGSGPNSIVDRPLNPNEYTLYQNFPNPFNPTTTIVFNLKKQDNVKIELMNTLGEVVKVIANGTYNAGLNLVPFNASVLASGVYFYKITTSEFTDVKKLTLLK